jgi:hypothetical protein
MLKTYNSVGLLNLFIMKMQELNLTEMKEINGGGLFGNNDSSNKGGLLGSIGIGNLLSFQTASKDGDEASASSFSIGNNIGGSLSGLFDSLSK